MTEIVWKEPAVRFLRKIDRKDSQRIIKKIEEISGNPFRFIKGLVNKNFSKIRIGNYRLFVDYFSKEDKLIINTIKSRKNAFNQKIYKFGGVNKFSMLPGDLQRSPDESFDTLVFIDETFLEKLSKYFGRGNYLKFDKILFSKNISEKQKLNCRQIFYYTAPPFQSEKPICSEIKKKKGYEKFVNQLRQKGMIVREGRCQRLKIDGAFVFRQKAVDILMAIDLMRIPLRYKNIQKIILVASDSDFVPVIKSLYEEGVKTILYTFYEKKRDTNFSRSNHLIKSVYKYVLLDKSDFDNSPLNKREEKGEQGKRTQNSELRAESLEGENLELRAENLELGGESLEGENEFENEE